LVSLAGTALAIVFACSFGAPPAQAQFVCGGSTDGSEPQTGAGATAAGDARNVACGANANASSTGTPSAANTAFGDGANASGGTTAAVSVNTATGFSSNASGDGDIYRSVPRTIALRYYKAIGASRRPIISVEDRRLYASVDTGFIGQNVYLFCASEGLASVFRGAVDYQALTKAMKLGTNQFVSSRRQSDIPRFEGMGPRKAVELRGRADGAVKSAQPPTTAGVCPSM
jgi:hypothetical protein